MPITLNILLEPNLDIAAFNAIVDRLKTVGIKVDPATAASFKQITNETLGTKDAVNKLEEATKKTGKTAEDTNKAFRFNEVREGIVSAANALTGLSAPAIALDTATASMSTLGAEAKEMAPHLRDAALVMSKDLPFAAADLQQTMYDALASGVQGGEEGLKKFADTSAKLATGGGSGIGDATKLLAGNLNAYGESAEKAAAYSDIFFNTINYGVVSASELSANLSNVVPTAAAAGIELENVGAAVALMTSKGIPAAQSTTKLNALLLEIQKPGAALAPILKAAGVSLESLKRDDLPVTLEKINSALKKTGQTATTVFSSSEAGAAFNTLAGDIDAFKDTFANVKNVTGSTDFAFAEMSGSMQVELDQIQAKAEAFVIGGLDKMGKGFLTVTSAATQLAPTVTSLVGLKSVIPNGLITNTGEFAKGLLTKVVPGIVATEGAAGAGATGFQLMWAAATGPIGLIVGGLAATVVGLHFLSDALHETAQEKLEDNATEIELLKTQKESTQAKFDQAAAAVSLTKQYKTLAENTNRSAEENKKFVDVSGKVAAAFPGVIDGSKSTEEQVKQLADAAESSAVKIANLGAEMSNIDKKLGAAQKVQLALEVDVAKEEIENQLTDAMGNILNSSAEWLLGTSTARTAAEDLSKQFTDKIYNAKTASEIAVATAEFQQKIAMDGEKLGIDKKDQLAVTKSISDFGKKRIDALKAMAENDKKVLETQQEDVSKTFAALTANGKSTADAVKLIASSFKISEDAANKAALAGTLKEAGKEGEVSKDKIAEIAKQFNVSKEQAAAVVDEQKKQKKQAEETASAVIDIAKSFQDLKKAAGDALSKSQDTAAGLRVALNDLKSGTLSLEDANKKYGLSALTVDEARIQLTKKLKDERDKASKADRENIALGRIADSENEEKKRSEREKNASTAATDKKRVIDRDLKIDEDFAKATIFNQNELAKRLLELQKVAELKKLDADNEAADKAAAIRAVTASAATIKADKAAAAVREEARKAKEREFNQKLIELDGKLALERYNAQKKREDEQANQDIERASKRAERLAVNDLAADESAADRANKLSDQKLKVLELQTDKEIDEIISKNDGVLRAEKDFEAALLSQNQTAIAKAATALATAKAAAYSSPLIQAAAEKEITGAEVIEKERAARLETIRIKSIVSRTEREAQTELAAAKEAFDKQFKDAEKNRDLELQAIADFGKKKLDIAKNQAIQENGLLAGIFSFKEKLIEEFNQKLDESAQKELEKTKQDNEAKQKELLKNLEAGKEKYKSYTDAIISMANQQREAEEKADNGRYSLLAKLQKAAVATFSDAVKKYDQKTNEQQEKYIALIQSGKATEEELGKQRIAIFTNVAVSAGAQLAQFAAAGELTLEKTLKIASKAALDVLESMIPVWSASILGVNLASAPGPVAIAEWLALTALLTGAVEAAKAAIGNKDGDARVKAQGGHGTIDGKPATHTSDNILRRLSEDEGILKAQANLTRGKYFANYEIIDIANKTSRSFEEIVLSKYLISPEPKFFSIPKPSTVITAVRDDLIYFNALEKAIKNQTAELVPVLGAIADNTQNTRNEIKRQNEFLKQGNVSKVRSAAPVKMPSIGGNY